MKEKEIIPTTGLDYLPMKLPKQENATSSFEEKCNGLENLISKSFNFFMWYASLPKYRRHELCSIVFLECLFLQMLSYIHETDDMRGHLLLDERLGLFQKILKMLNDQMRTGRTFIIASNGKLMDETQNGTSCFVEARNETVVGFREHTEWLKKFCLDDGNKAQVNALADKLQLNYPMKQFACMGDDFDQHANMTFNSLMKLAIPSMANYSENDFARVFDNSINTFRKSRSWMVLEAQLEEKLNDDLKNCGSNATKMAKTKEDWWKPQKEAVEKWLRRFGITYINVLSQDKKGMVSRQLYERLNKIRIDKKDESHFVPMTNNDLCQYLKLESELMFFANKIEEFRKLEDGEHKKTDEKPMTGTAMAEKGKDATPSKKTFMKHEADERKLPSVMRDANKQVLDGQHHAVTDGVGWKDYHVAICLLFYLRASNNAEPAILSGLTRAYYNSFDKKEFTTICTYEQFHRTLNKLNDVDFRKVIACKSVNEVKYEKIGHGTLQTWYKFYHLLLPIFKLHLPER